jgi:hypothetical protein
MSAPHDDLAAALAWLVQAADDLATARRLVNDGGYRRGWRRSSRTRGC